MGKHRVGERDDTITPLVHDVMQPQQCTDVRLVKAEQRFGDMAGPPRRARRQCVTRSDLELKAGVQFAKVMEVREKRQPGRSCVGEFVGIRCSRKPRAQHRGTEQGLEARRDIGAVMFETMRATR